MFVRVLNFPGVETGLATFTLLLVLHILFALIGDPFVDLQNWRILSSFGELMSFCKFLAICTQ